MEELKKTEELQKVELVLNLTGQKFIFDAYQGKNEELIITHNSIKRNAINIIKNSFLKNDGARINYEYNSIQDSPGHCIVDCTFSMKSGYKITETGETTTRTLDSDIAKNYPYLEAQKRAFDRAFISFFILDLDGKRIYSDSELK